PQVSNNDKIVTNCSDTTVDADNQFNPKDLIFRTSNASDNQWVVIYNKKWRNILCNSPKQNPSLVTDKTKCKQLIGRNQTVIELIDPSIVKSIDDVVENPSGNVIHGYYIFFRRDGRPVFCDKSMFVPKNRFNILSEAYIYQHIHYASDVDIDLGYELTPLSVKNEPTVQWPTEEGEYYTLALVDPDGEFAQLNIGRYEGIGVFGSNVHRVTYMYTNAIQWQFDVPSRKMSDLSPIGKGIIKRFSGNDYDCYVKYQTVNYIVSNFIETHCYYGNTNTTDIVSNYNPKAIIFRASSDSTNEWVVIYSRKGSLISCYSPKQSPSLVTNKTQCRKLIGRNKTVIETIDPSIVESIDGIVEGIDVFNNRIIGYHIFFNRDGRPVFCSKPIDDTTKTCNLEKDITYILPDCFPPEKGWFESWGKIALIAIGAFVLIFSIICGIICC
ncbi:unnamed protein product, partial [Medioppia subpectinata]